MDHKTLLESLRQLVEALGLPAYEAEYISAEVDRRFPPERPKEPDLAERVSTLRERHERLAERLRQLDVEPGHLDLLIETEGNRFRDQLLELLDDDDGTDTSDL